MNDRTAVIDRLRGLHRGFKFAILLIAAWAPFMFPSAPWVGGVLMAAMTVLFFLVTSPPRSTRITVPETSAGDIDAEP
jgi:hypothetical protein